MDEVNSTLAMAKYVDASPDQQPSVPVEEVGVPAVRSDLVTKYLANMAGILSSMVVDMNAQIAAINRTQEGQ